MAKSRTKPVGRRGFLKGAAAGAAAGTVALVAPVSGAGAQQAPAVAPRGSAPTPSAASLAAETEPVEVTGGLTVENAGSDFMVDVFKSLGFEYIASNPGSSFRGLQESFITYGKNQSPEWLTCCHEESSIAIADGYFRVSGKPMMAMAHGTVGLQHAAMTVYNSFVARVPVYIVLGNAVDANNRRPGVEWNHSVQDASAMVREFIKWDDTPISLTHFAESAVRAYKIAMTVPTAPVILVADGDLQENSAGDRSKLRIPKLTLTSPPAGDPAAVAEVARLLVGAENPVILAGRVARTEQGMALMIELAETLQAPVQGGRARYAQSASVERRRLGCQRGCDPCPAAGRPLGRHARLPRPAGALLPPSHETGRETDQHQLEGPLHEEQLPGLPALRGGRHGHRRRCGDDAAFVNRSLQEVDHRR